MTEQSINEENLGPFFKQLRLSKSFTLKEAAGDAMSSKHLSNFENGRTDLSAHLFLDALANINVDTFEFQNLYNQHLQEKDLLLFRNDISQAFLIRNQVALRHLLAKLEALPAPSKKIKLEKVRIQAVLAFLEDDFSVAENEVYYLKNYLSGIKDWGDYEILLFSDCVPILDLMSISKFLHAMIVPTQLNFNLVQVKQVRVQAILNGIDCFIENKQFALAEEMIAYLQNGSIHDYWMFEKLRLTYSQALLDEKKGLPGSAERLQKCQDFLEFSGCFSLANEMAKRLPEHLKGNK